MRGDVTIACTQSDVRMDSLFVRQMDARRAYVHMSVRLLRGLYVPVQHIHSSLLYLAAAFHAIVSIAIPA